MRVLTPRSKSVQGTELICASSKCLSCALCEPGTALSTRHKVTSESARACLLGASRLMDAHDKEVGNGSLSLACWDVDSEYDRCH